MSKAPTKFTKTAVQDLPPAPAGKRVFHYDSVTPGLSVQVTHTGAKTFYLYRWVSGKPERVRLGAFPATTVEQARKLAAEHLATIAKGESPRAQKRAKAAVAITLTEVFEEYLASRDLKPGTVFDYRRVMREGFDDWKNRRLVDITRDMVERKHAQLGERSAARANNSMRVLRALMNFAAGKYEDANGHPIMTDIPTKRLSATRSWYRVERRQTSIKVHQLRDWWNGVNALSESSATIADYLRVLILTGLRRTEAARLAWADVDLESRTLIIRDPKNRLPHTLPLSDYLMALFTRRREDARPEAVYVFPAANNKARPITEPRCGIEKVVTASGVEFTPHDLRRTFATIAESLDLSAYAIKALMNHKNAGDVTQGYIMGNAERLREPMQRITDFILKAAGEKDTASVVELPARHG